MNIDLTAEPTPAPVDMRKTRLRLIGRELVERAEAKPYRGGIVGLVLDGDEVLLTIEAARALTSFGPGSLSSACWRAEQAEERARGAHLFRIYRRSSRLVVKHRDREGWLEPMVIRKARECRSCRVVQSPKSTMYRECESVPKTDHRGFDRAATDPRWDRFCAACVNKAEAEPTGELVALDGGAS